MTDERKVQLAFEVDSTGAKKGLGEVEQAAKGMVASVAQAAKPASEAVDKIGSGGQKAAGELDRATKSIIGSIQRTTAVMEAGERGTSKYFQALAAQRGANVEALKPYLAQLDAAHAKQGVATGSLNAMGSAAAQTGVAMRAMITNLVAGVVSVGAAFESIRRAINLGDDLQRMADTTGLAIGKLDQLSIVANLNNASLDDMAKAWKFLGSSMVEAQTASSKSAQLFTALGVSTKDAVGNLRGVDDVMGDVAKALDSIENETTRAAAGTAIFGKSYLQIAAALRNYSEDQERANKVVAQFGGVSADAAKLSDELGDKFTLLGEGSKRALLGSLVPGMAAVNVGLDEMLKSGGRFQQGFGEILSWLATWGTKVLIGFGAMLKADAQVLAAFIASITTKSLDPLRALPGDLKAIALEAADSINAVTAAYESGGKATAPHEGLTKTKTDLTAIMAALAGGKEKTDEFARALERVKQIAAEARNELAGMFNQESLTRGSKELVKLMASDVWPKFSATQKETLKTILEQASAVEREAKSWEDLGKAAADFAGQRADERKKWDDDIAKNKQSTSDLVATLDFETKTMFQTNEERERAIALSKIIYTSEVEYEEQVKRVNEAFDKRNAAADLKKSLQEQKTAWENTYRDISNSITDALLRGFESGKDFASNFVQTLKNMFATLILRPIIQFIVSPISGAITAALGGIIPGMANASTGAASAGNLFSGASTAWNALTGGFDNAAAAITKLFSPSAGALMAAGAGDPTAVGAFASLGPAIAAAMPWAAIAAIGIPLAVSAFSKSGGPKSGGFATAGTIGALTGTDSSGRWFTPSTDDARVLQQVQAMTATYSSLVKMLGGTAGAAGFALGFDTDPRGTAPNRLHVGAYLGGQSVYEAALGDLGRDSAALEAALQTEGAKAILAALKASGIAQDIADYLDSVAPDQLATRLGEVAKAFSLTNDALQIMGKSAADFGVSARMGLVDAAGGADAFAQKFGAFTNTFYSEAERLSVTQDAIASSFERMGVALPDSKDAFRSLVEGLDLSTDAGRALFNTLLDIAPAFAQVADAADAMISDLRAVKGQLGTGTLSGGVAQTQMSLIQKFASSPDNPWAAGLLAQLGQSGFVRNLSLIGEEDFKKYSLANQDLIRAILHSEVDLRDTRQESVATTRDYTAAVDDSNRALEQMQAALRGIGEYVNSLLVGDLSPLTPMQRLGEARSQYEQTLAMAQGGDLGAVGDLSKVADTYLRLARDAFASSARYTDIFNDVVGSLTGVAGGGHNLANFGGGPQNPVAVLSSAIPAGSTLASRADIEAMADRFVRAIAALAEANTADSASIETTLKSTSVALAQSIVSSGWTK